MGTIIDYVAEKPVNPYTTDIAELIEAGEGKATVIDVEAGVRSDKEGNPQVVSRVGVAKRLLSEAARDAGYTARFAKITENDDKTASIIVKLGKLVTRRTKEELEADAAQETADVESFDAGNTGAGYDVEVEPHTNSRKGK
jgi:hypothetical protein